MARTAIIPHSRPHLCDADLAAVRDALDSGMIARGERTDRFEDAMAARTGAARAVATCSGTAALRMAIEALVVNPGDEVIIPTYVCHDVLDAVLAAGATAMLCDVGEDWVMTPDSVAPQLTSRTRAIVVTHIFGIDAGTEGFRRFGVPLIEDACQAIGPRSSGIQGDIAVLSFHATKCLTTGEGGMVLTDDDDLADRVRSAAATGCDLSDLQGALGLAQLERYESFLGRRQTIATTYLDALADLAIELPHRVADRTMWYRFPVHASGPFEATREAFAAVGVRVRRGVDALLHALPGHEANGFETAERLFEQTVSLPIYPALDDAGVDRVIAAAHEIWSHGRVAHH